MQYTLLNPVLWFLILLSLLEFLEYILFSEWSVKFGIRAKRVKITGTDISRIPAGKKITLEDTVLKRIDEGLLIFRSKFDPFSRSVPRAVLMTENGEWYVFRYYSIISIATITWITIYLTWLMFLEFNDLMGYWALIFIIPATIYPFVRDISKGVELLEKSVNEIIVFAEGKKNRQKPEN